MQEALVTPGNSVLAFSMEVDMATAQEVRSVLAPLVERGGPVVIDLAGVRFMDSTGIHALIDAATALGDRGCIILHGANAQVTNLFEITDLRSLASNIHITHCAQPGR
jgi:stage II sporulation protein AA (anti-sigma F factor antagonist)